MINKGICDKGFNWNPSNCECACDKSCDVEEYLDYKNCQCIKGLLDKLVEECSADIYEKKLHSMEFHSNNMVSNSTLNDNNKICRSCTVYIVLFVILFIISIRISSLFIYFHWYLKYIYSSSNLLNATPFNI